MSGTSLSDLQFARYRQVLTFGADTIHKFSNNTSGMKQLVARDFEDLLQVRNMSVTSSHPLTKMISV